MKSSLRNKLESLARRLVELDANLSSEDVVRDMDRYRALTRERADIEPVVARYKEYALAEADVATANELARDPQMKAFADEEHASATAKMGALAADLQRMLLPQDPNDERNVFLEIRAGTGGDESALFAGSLCRMYTRYAERAGWKVEIVSESPAELGGYKEVILRIIGRGAYSKLKFESGGHRVQRVPETEAQGRIHTSACTVAVLPEADPVADITINPADIRVDTFRASGAGGQHVNKTSSRVEIFWSITGSRALTDEQRTRLLDKLSSRLTTEGSIRVVASDMRSQSRNRELVEERLAELVRRALVVPRKRKPTKPTRAAKEARLESKKLHSNKKRTRQNKSFD